MRIATFYGIVFSVAASIAASSLAQDPLYPNAASATPEIAALMKKANEAYMQCITPQSVPTKVGPSMPHPRLIAIDPFVWPKATECGPIRKGRIILEVLVSKDGTVLCSRILSCTVPQLAIATASLTVGPSLHFAPGFDGAGAPVSAFTLVVVECHEDGSVEIKK